MLASGGLCLRFRNTLGVGVGRIAATPNARCKNSFTFSVCIFGSVSEDFVFEDGVCLCLWLTVECGPLEAFFGDARLSEMLS